ncbi:hypothetical protein LOY43_18840 [Pseudomonas sp. B21-041]|uniref:O-methyltransferase n=1 Tax=Pseudomonas sp. B21-041 TaxID=2895487 RepID=UPI00215F8487|nr:O-methyltransferase [Pseudomonas sp. B21-041]UVL33023.1 hypothetical protein LOY43_18840 [Pseudomonas sp. B21-041]
MSQGGSIAYHLRQNKAIERNLFVDLLGRVGRYVNISSYSYIGFGGPFLEDFKHLHSALRISKMISLEMDSNVFKRQLFNKPLSCISLRNESSGDFLNKFEFDSDDGSIVWFDYANTDITSQLTETQRLIEKLGHGDIFKITVNASPTALGEPNVRSETLAFRAKVLAGRLSSYGPAEITEDSVATKNYPKTLLAAIMSAAKHGLAGDPSLVVQPLAAFVYSDGQQMLTVTGILLHENEIQNFLEQSRLPFWSFFNPTCVVPTSISVPVLSTRERVHIESLLPEAGADDIQRALDYYTASTEKISKEEMGNFVNFYRMFPWYSRVVL